MMSACVNIERVILGPIANNVYALSDETSLVLVDPGFDAQSILAFLKGRTPDAIFVTHAHWDHVGALAELKRATGAPVYASATEKPLIDGTNPSWGARHGIEPCAVDHAVADGELLTVGTMTWSAMITPGHSSGSTCFYIDPAHAQGAKELSVPVLVSGDTLFEGNIGRTDFEGGSFPQMRQSLTRLATLQDDAIVLPGHGNPTTIGAERIRVFKRYGA